MSLKQQVHNPLGITILFLAANPVNSDRLHLDQEMRAIDEALRGTQYQDSIDLRSHWAVQIGDVQQLLLRYKPDIVHFSGHGSATSEIILQNDKGELHPVSERALSNLFSILKDNLHCVVLNACYSTSQANSIAQYIDCVVGMSDKISDDAARNFSQGFYNALGWGRDIQTAFELGCNRIDLANLDEEGKPHLTAFKAIPSEVFVTGFILNKVDVQPVNKSSVGLLLQKVRYVTKSFTSILLIGIALSIFLMTSMFVVTLLLENTKEIVFHVKHLEDQKGAQITEVISYESYSRLDNTRGKEALQTKIEIRHNYRFKLTQRLITDEISEQSVQNKIEEIYKLPRLNDQLDQQETAICNLSIIVPAGKKANLVIQWTERWANGVINSGREGNGLRLGTFKVFLGYIEPCSLISQENL